MMLHLAIASALTGDKASTARPIADSCPNFSSPALRSTDPVAPGLKPSGLAGLAWSGMPWRLTQAVVGTPLRAPQIPTRTGIKPRACADKLSGARFYFRHRCQTPKCR